MTIDFNSFASYATLSAYNFKIKKIEERTKIYTYIRARKSWNKESEFDFFLYRVYNILKPSPTHPTTPGKVPRVTINSKSIIAIVLSLIVRFVSFYRIISILLYNLFLLFLLLLLSLISFFLLLFFLLPFRLWRREKDFLWNKNTRLEDKTNLLPFSWSTLVFSLSFEQKGFRERLLKSNSW